MEIRCASRIVANHYIMGRDYYYGKCGENESVDHIVYSCNIYLKKRLSSKLSATHKKPVACFIFFYWIFTQLRI